MQTDIPYLTLDPNLEAQIIKDKSAGYKSPYRFDEANVQRRENKAHDNASSIRPAFVRDIEKIINIPAYNRYIDKTQVFSLVRNDDICRRGLHVQLVGRIARTIGSALGLNTDLIEAISLAHDIGHTPFGHAGEHFLCACFHNHTGRYFNHNVHSVRVLDRLYRRNISLQVLDGALCHNGEFAQQTLLTGSLTSFEALDNTVQACVDDESCIKTLRPSTLEGCVVRVSDMIAYVGKDRLDALSMGVIESLEVFDSSYIGKDNARIIHNLTTDIVANSYGKKHISMSTAAFKDLKRAKQQNNELIYSLEGQVFGSGNIVGEMFEELYEKLLGDITSQNEDSPLFTRHIAHISKQSHDITLDNYLMEDPNQIVVDYMASLTDNSFLSLYNHVFPDNDKVVAIRDYFD